MKIKSAKRLKVILGTLGILLAAGLLAACGSGIDKDSSQGKAQTLTEEYSRAAQDQVPYPMDAMKQGNWTERKNVSERLQRYANPSKISYIYLFSQQGQLMANYTVKGKVSNTSSQMTNATQVIDACGDGCADRFPVDAPMDDGTWGPSEDAIFFFTTDGVLVEWSGEYVLADAPLNLTSKPLLVYNEGSKPTSVADQSTYGTPAKK